MWGERVDLVGAVVLGAGHKHLGQLRVERELGHRRAQLRQVAVLRRARDRQLL